MNMSMDKPMALHSAEGTRGPQDENAKMRSKTRSPRHGNWNMNMSMDKSIALNRTEGTFRDHSSESDLVCQILFAGLESDWSDEWG